MTTKVVHCKKDSYDVYIGRPSRWGNPYEIGEDGTREEVIDKFRQLMLKNPDMIAMAKKDLKGKTLGCWCKPEACHGDVLVELIDG